MVIKVWNRIPNIPWFEALSSVLRTIFVYFFVPRGAVKMITWSDPTNITLVPFFHSCVESPSPSTWIARSLIICAAYDVGLSQVLFMLDHRLVVYNFRLYQIVLNLVIWLSIYYHIIKSLGCQFIIKSDCELIILSDCRFMKTLPKAQRTQDVWFSKLDLLSLVWFGRIGSAGLVW